MRLSIFKTIPLNWLCFDFLRFVRPNIYPLTKYCWDAAAAVVVVVRWIDGKQHEVFLWQQFCSLKVLFSVYEMDFTLIFPVVAGAWLDGWLVVRLSVWCYIALNVVLLLFMLLMLFCCCRIAVLPPTIQSSPNDNSRSCCVIVRLALGDRVVAVVLQSYVRFCCSKCCCCVLMRIVA